MKKITALILILVFLILQINLIATAQENDPFDISNYDNPELDLTNMTMDDLLALSSEGFAELVSEFERVYDPFDTYNVEMELSSIDSLSNDNSVSPAWTSGDYNVTTGEYLEEGTHEAITGAACAIMLNDRGFYSDKAGSIIVITMYIAIGSLLPDRELSEVGLPMFVGHFYNPTTGKNWLGGTENTARNNAQDRYNTAVAYACAGNMEKAYEYLGRCLHYIQDLNVPHHSANVTTVNPGSTHSAFEQYAENNFDACMEGYDSVGVNNYDYYPANYDVGGIAHLAAYYSYQRIGYVNDANDTSQWYNQARIGLRNAARYSVMVMYKFANEASVPFYAN